MRSRAPVQLRWPVWAGWTEMGVWDWPQVNPFFAPTERMALRSREIRMTQTADIKPFWLEDGATLYNDLCIHGWQLWTSCTIHLSTDPTAQINQAPHQKYTTKNILILHFLLLCLLIFIPKCNISQSILKESLLKSLVTKANGFYESCSHSMHF